jgi:hypothetical protein
VAVMAVRAETTENERMPSRTQSLLSVIFILFKLYSVCLSLFCAITDIKNQAENKFTNVNADNDGIFDFLSTYCFPIDNEFGCVEVAVGALKEALSMKKYLFSSFATKNLTHVGWQNILSR